MKNISATEFQTVKQSEEVVLIDVREKDEYQAGHIPGADNFPLSELDRLLLPTDTAVSKLPALHLDAEQSKAIGFGQRVKFANEQQLSGQVRLFSAENLFLGVALIDGNIIRPQRLITQSA